MGEKVPEAWLSLEKHLDKYAVLAELPFLSEKLSLRYFVVLWSSDRRLTSGLEGPRFEYWLCQVDVEPLGKALYMHFPHPTHV